jgi:hypothetical protein
MTTQTIATAANLNPAAERRRARQHSFAGQLLGGRWRDIEAERRAGCRTVFLGSGYGEELPSPLDAMVSTVSEAAEWILAQKR